MPSRRRLARICAMQAVFEMQMREIDPLPSLQKNVEEQGGEKSVDAAFAGILTKGVSEHWKDIQSAVTTHAPQWPWERMDSISRSILAVAAFELLYGKDAPPAVVMNEAIDITKEFGTGEGAKFVNGVLNALAHAGK